MLAWDRASAASAEQHEAEPLQSMLRDTALNSHNMAEESGENHTLHPPCKPTLTWK